MKYAVKGLNAHQNIPTGPFETKAEAVKWLLDRSCIRHIKENFKSVEDWCDFMIFESK